VAGLSQPNLVLTEAGHKEAIQLNHQRQGINECLPTTIAMLSGQPRHKIIKKILGKLPIWDINRYMSWSRAYSRSDIIRIHGIIDRLFSDIGIPRMSADSIQASVNIPQTLPKGRGSILVFFENDTKHIVAFEDGFVYDGNYSLPWSWLDWIISIPALYGSCIRCLTITSQKEVSHK
jgi:hypothetical protein